MFDDIIGEEEKFYDDVIEFEYHGDFGETEEFHIDEKELDEAIEKIIEEALKNIDL